jgi:hypothetical protein
LPDELVSGMTLKQTMRRGDNDSVLRDCEESEENKEEENYLFLASESSFSVLP